MLNQWRVAHATNCFFAGVLMISMGFSAPAEASGAAPSGTGGIMTPAPDGDAAVRKEYDTTVRKGTREAYELFVLRHPDHPLADEARAWLAR